MTQSKILFDPPPGEMEIKTQINKWDLMKLKSFCTAKEPINKTQRQPSDGENSCFTPTLLWGWARAGARTEIGRASGRERV